MANAVTNFVKLVIAAVKGDEAEVLGLKIQKKAQAAVKAQIAAKEAYSLDLEAAVDTAKEALAAARINNGEIITNNTAYITNLLTAKAAVEEAEIEYEAHLESIEFLKEELAQIEA